MTSTMAVVDLNQLRFILLLQSLLQRTRVKRARRGTFMYAETTQDVEKGFGA